MKGWVVWGDVCEGLLFVEPVTGVGVSVVGRLCGLTGAGGGIFAPAGKAGFLIVTGAMGVAVFGDSMGFCTGVGAGAGTAGLMGFAAADAGVCGGVCRFGNGAEDGVWLAG